MQSYPIITSASLFHVKKQATKAEDLSPSGFCSPAESAAFWKNLNPTPFPSKLRQQGPSVFTLASKVGPLKSDAADMCLTVLFSDLLTTTHPSMFGPYAHPVLRKRSKQPVTNAATSKDNVPPKKTTSTSTPKGTRAQIARLVQTRVIPKSDNQISFSAMFPSTDLPHVNLVNGLPRINKAIFNSLLISKLRAAKTALNLPSKERISNDIVSHISRLMDKAIITALNSKKTKEEKRPAASNKAATTPKLPKEPTAQPNPRSPKGKKTKKNVEFVSPKDTTTPTSSTKDQAKEEPIPKPTVNASSDNQLSLKDLQTIKSLNDCRLDQMSKAQVESILLLDHEQANHCLFIEIASIEDVTKLQYATSDVPDLLYKVRPIIIKDTTLTTPDHHIAVTKHQFCLPGRRFPQTTQEESLVKLFDYLSPVQPLDIVKRWYELGLAT